MAFAHVQSSGYAGWWLSTDPYRTFGSAPTEGNLLILAAGGDYSSTTVSTINSSSPAAGGWTVAGQAAPSHWCVVYYKVAGASEATSYNVDLSGNSHSGLWIAEYSFSDTLALGAEVSTGAPQVADIEVTAPGLAINCTFSGGGMGGTGPASADGFTLRGSRDYHQGSYACGDLVVSSTADHGTSWDATGGAAVQCSFYEDSGGGHINNGRYWRKFNGGFAA